MTDTLSPAQRSERMSRVRGKDTGPELAVRRMTHAMGFRYRLHRNDLPGAPDLVFKKKRKVIFVHGCFWHRHSAPECPFARMPKSRQAFWGPKLEANRQRDISNESKLADLGWSVLVVWECELRQPNEVRNRIERFLQEN